MSFENFVLIFLLFIIVYRIRHVSIDDRGLPSFYNFTILVGMVYIIQYIRLDIGYLILIPSMLILIYLLGTVSENIMSLFYVLFLCLTYRLLPMYDSNISLDMLIVLSTLVISMELLGISNRLYITQITILILSLLSSEWFFITSLAFYITHILSDKVSKLGAYGFSIVWLVSFIILLFILLSYKFVYLIVFVILITLLRIPYDKSIIKYYLTGVDDE